MGWDRTGSLQRGLGLRASSQWLVVAWLSACLSLLTGCASVQWRDGNGHVQHFGVLSYKLEDTKTARILVLENFGLHIRVESSDPGFTFGYRKYIAVQPRPDHPSLGPKEGYFSLDDHVSSSAGLYFRKQLGIELGFGDLSDGLSIGYDRRTVILGPTAGESSVGKIDFYEEDLKKTVFEQRR